MSLLRRNIIASSVSALAVLLPTVLAQASAPAYLDPGFGVSGVATVDALPVPSWATAVALQPDGKIVVAGTRQAFTQDGDAVVARLLPDGRLDPAFGTSGVYVLDDGGNETWATEVAVQADGRVVVLVSAKIWKPESLGAQLDLLRLDSTGHLDPTFGAGGIVHVTAPGPTINTQRSGMTLDAGGRIVVVGNTASSSYDANVDMLVARFTANGTPDATFGTSGVALVDFGTPAAPRDDLAMTVVVEPDGRLVIGGQSMLKTVPHTTGFALARLSSVGALDPTFGVDGRVLTILAALGKRFSYVNALALQADGRIVAAGTALVEVDTSSPRQSVVARYTPAGALDPTFASGGVRINQFEVDSQGDGLAVSLDAAGRVVLGGTRIRSVNGHRTSDMEVVRLLPSGALDPTFGGNGRIVTRLTPDFDQVMGLAIQSDGRVVAAGHAGDEFSVLRFLPTTGVRAFGFNPFGELGIGTTVDAHVPVAAPGLVGAESISSGLLHGLAVKGDGSVWSFGWNGVGQLGDGTTSDSASPVPVSIHTPVVAAAAGAYHSLGLGEDGLVWAWGWNPFGQLGDGTTVDRHEPFLVPGVSDVVGIAAGTLHSLAVLRDGTVLAWGSNVLGELGDGTTTDRLRPALVPGLTGVVAVAAGGFHSLALKADGTVWAWGWNGVGQLGDGTVVDRHAPVPVAALSGVTAVAAGTHHNLAVLADGSLRGWGWNALNQLGDGTAVDRNQPVPIAGLSAVISVAAGPYHSLAAQADGTVRAWGWNGTGALGTGTTTASASPIVVPDLTGVTAVSAGFANSLAVVP